jgi:hypothetical protein
MAVANLLPEPVLVTLSPQPVSGSGWTLTSSETTMTFLMNKDEVPRQVSFDLTPGPLASDSFLVDIEANLGASCGTFKSGGGRLHAKLASSTGVVASLAPVPALVMSPRPFWNELNIAFVQPRAGRAGIRICDVTGRLVRKIDLGEQRAGVVHARWDGRTNGGVQAPPGVYFVRVSAGDLQLNSRTTRLR